jgi:hypothetical protein
MLDIVIHGNDEQLIKGPLSEPWKVLFTGDKITYFEELKGLLKSLNLNWRGARVFFVHSLELTKRYKELLKQYDVDTVFQPCELSNINLMQQRQRLNFYKSGGFGGTHSLVLDYDVLCLSPPILDFSKDMQVMYSGSSYNKKWDAMYMLCGVDSQVLGYNHSPACLFAEYHLRGTKNLFPLFNHGVVFVRNDFAKCIYKEIEKYIDDLSGYKTLFSLQVASCIAMIKHTRNWSVLPKGCNFIPVLKPKDAAKWKDKISLYHYCGSRPVLDRELYNKYFI